jgi:1-acyl-sn-glycerol-3-phosphate acyltransferase
VTQILQADPLGDCEAGDAGMFVQDVNAWSSLAYVAVGVVIAAVVVRRRVAPVFLALAAAAVAEGVGSVLYHGRGGDAARIVHDGALTAMLGFIAGWHVARMRPGRAAAGALVGLGLGAVAGVAGGASSAAVTNAFVGAATVLIAGSEVLARRRRLPAIWNAGTLALVAIALLSWILGRSGSPVCDAGSWVQPHGLWHTLSAVVALAWLDRAAAASQPEAPPRLWRRATDRAFGVLAVLLTHAFHRSVDVSGRGRIPAGRPLLIVANHGNGFVDPIVVTSVLRRLPRFLAKAALWKVVVVRPLLSAAGVLPVYRSDDGDRAGANRSVFAACHRELAVGATVAIFPEGTTGDRAGLDRVRAGAARIALGAVATAPDLAIVPIGLAFESRVQTRSRAVVIVGDTLDAAAFASRRLDGDGEPDRDDVRTLTASIRRALEEISPEFASVEEREIFRAAARAACDADRRRGAASFGEVEVVARRLAAASGAARDRVAQAYRRYATHLQLSGITDEQLGPRTTTAGRVALAAVVAAVVGSFVFTATLIHLPALVLTVGASGAVHSTATKGTVRMLVGLFSGLATWIVAGVVLGDGIGALVAAVTVAAGGALALAVWAPLTRAASLVWGRLRARDRGSLIGPVFAARTAVVDAVGAALAEPPVLPIRGGG